MVVNMVGCTHDRGDREDERGRDREYNPGRDREEDRG